MPQEGRYQHKGTLGEGGMGVVYHAYDTELMREVAIKVIKGEAILDYEARQRFDQEAKSAGMLKHPNIVTIYDRGEVNGQPFIVMEMVEGRTLQSLIKSGEPGPTQYLAILRQVAAALDYAHSRQVVHRDIKPANIMVQPDGTAKVMDFGIAKSELAGGGGVTAAGMLVGSPHYVPPERYTTGMVSGSTDLWALAVTAYEALAGRKPFQADNWDTLTYQICHEPAVDPGSLPGAGWAALRKALSKKPEDRYPDCSSFIDALAEGFKPAPPPPPPPPPPPANHTKQYAAAGIAAGLVLAAVLWYVTRPDNPTLQPPIVKKEDPPPPAIPAGMVLVPAGDALLGKQADQRVSLPAFYIDKTEVPVSAYRQFCQETGRSMTAALESAAPDLPVTGVTWADANAYAIWAGKRLPKAEEWEKAARGSDGQALPWRGETRSDRANIPLDRKATASLVSATSFPAGASPYGALNMLGNVWEWTATQVPTTELDRYRKIFRELTPPLSEADVFYEVRGGSFRFDAPIAEWPVFVWDFNRTPARVHRPDIGFRCVRNVP
jgi:serine/threonine-protein kinase